LTGKYNIMRGCVPMTSVLHELSTLPCVQCRPLNARLTQRGCRINQSRAEALAIRLRNSVWDGAGGLPNAGDTAWVVLSGCASCDRCDRVTPADVDLAQDVLRGLWRAFGRYSLEHSDPELRRRRRAAYWQKWYARQKENGGRGRGRDRDHNRDRVKQQTA
jgi:hypothetical protein